MSGCKLNQFLINHTHSITISSLFLEIKTEPYNIWLDNFKMPYCIIGKIHLKIYMLTP